MSATIGTFAARTISFSAAVASAVGQDTRMMSAPASSQRRIWSIVALASSVGVLVMVWTLIGASPPTATEPTMICRDVRRSISRQGRMDMRRHIGPRRPSAKLRSGGIRAEYPVVLTGLTGLARGRLMGKLVRLPALGRAPEAADADGRRIPRLHTRYYAFLSYSHKDKDLADWLHRELERFCVPRALRGRLTANGVVPKRLTPIFRDDHELAAAGDLAGGIQATLAVSQYLTVSSSPTA